MPVVVSIEPDATVQRAAVLLRAHGVGMLVVVSAGVVVGLVTRADIIRAVPA